MPAASCAASAARSRPGRLERSGEPRRQPGEPGGVRQRRLGSVIEEPDGLVRERGHGRALLLEPDGARVALLEQAAAEQIEALGREERAQEPLPVVVLREQELVEAVLRQQDHLEELVLRQADDPADVGAHLLRARREPDPGAVDLLQQLDLRRLGRGAGAAPFRPLVLGRAPDAVDAPRRLELELGEGLVLGAAVVAPEARGGAVEAGDRAVERERDRVEDRRLARSGAPGDEVHAHVLEPVEVDALLGAERSESGEGESADPHRRASASTAASASRVRARSVSVAP
ncbi:hypothetical protein [Rathayibacter sp. VKM Ac-2762]|uniref:hypothetical protein n=1 Tax=Rathayibacter sp. VKM Ac-2762 TaxID=2609254 RepID=UPI001FC997B0|nr:hypothetical protein [Rathayibacter sp. VKM Ac-2762]